MIPSTFDKVPSPFISKNQCWCCKAKRKHWVPRLDDVPEPLRNLSQATAESLAPVQIDTGVEVRSWQSKGYRAHMGMIRFSWYSSSVQSALRALSPAEQEKGNAALEWLVENNVHYRHFLQEHADFLRKYPQSTDKDRRRWLRFIERPGVETAVWPHLFWDAELCLTVERQTLCRQAKEDRRILATTEQRVGLAAWDDPYAEEDNVDDAGHSIKRSYVAKLLSPLLGYASYDILHFAYDLVL